MRYSAFAMTLVIPLLASSAVHGQSQARPPGEVKYFVFSSDFFGGDSDNVDGFLKETRQGSRVTGAVLDLCYSVPNQSRKDRFMVNLNVEGNNLVGTGQSQIEKLPVAVRLTRRVTAETFSFEGTVKRGTVDAKVNLQEQSDITEAEFNDQQPSGTTIAATPMSFTEVSPGAVAARVKRESFVALVRSLKADNVKVDLDSLVTECPELRSGFQVVTMKVDPERAPGLIQKIKSAPGVAAAGWKEGNYIMDWAVRIPAGNWRAGGRVDRDKLGSAISESFGKVLSASVQSTATDPVTGEMTFKLKRRNTTLPDFGLTDNLEVTALIGPEKPGASDALIVWVSEWKITTADEGSEPRLTLSARTGEGEDGSQVNFIDSDTVVGALARDLRGRTWDSEKEDWKP